jgi:TfoX/Sxy family transcriptional regulator of competence genes
MAFDEILADRVRDVLVALGPFEERKMFGGVCFTVGGRMCCGVLRDDLIVKVGPDRGAQLLAGDPNVRPFDFSGRPMSGMLYVAPPGTHDDDVLRQRVHESVEFAAAQPDKTARSQRKK